MGISTKKLTTSTSRPCHIRHTGSAVSVPYVRYQFPTVEEIKEIPKIKLQIRLFELASN